MHPSTENLMRWLQVNPNLEGKAREVAEECEVTAARLVRALPEGPELSAGLRHLLEAKDCFVRAALS